MEKVQALKNKFDLIEKEQNIILPDWYKGYFYADCFEGGIHHKNLYVEDRPIEYIYYAIK